MEKSRRKIEGGVGRLYRPEKLQLSVKRERKKKHSKCSKMGESREHKHVLHAVGEKETMPATNKDPRQRAA